jgi:hypothetical protein
MTDHKLPLLYVFERKPEIEREEGFLLAGKLAIDPIIPEAGLEEVTLSIIHRVCCRGCSPESWGCRP